EFCRYLTFQMGAADWVICFSGAASDSRLLHIPSIGFLVRAENLGQLAASQVVGKAVGVTVGKRCRGVGETAPSRQGHGAADADAPSAQGSQFLDGQWQ